MTHDTLQSRLDAGPVICAEGYLFELERRGYLQAGPFVPEVVLEHPEAVRENREKLRAVSCHVAALPVIYRTTEAEPTFQALSDSDCACIPDERPFPTALDPFTCNRGRTDVPVATNARRSPAPAWIWTCATSVCAAAQPPTMFVPSQRRWARLRPPAGIRRTWQSTPSSARMMPYPRPTAPVGRKSEPPCAAFPPNASSA